MFSFLFSVASSTVALAAVTSGLGAELSQQVERSHVILRANSDDSSVEPSKKEMDRISAIVLNSGLTLSSGGLAYVSAKEAVKMTAELLKSKGMTDDILDNVSNVLSRAGSIMADAYSAQSFARSASGGVQNSIDLVQKKTDRDALLNEKGATKMAQAPTALLGDLFLLSPAERSAFQNDLAAAIKDKARSGESKDLDLGAIFLHARASGKELFSTPEQKRLQKLFASAPAKPEAAERKLSQDQNTAYLVFATARLQEQLENTGASWTPNQKRRARELIDGNLAAIRKVAMLTKGKKSSSANGDEAGEAGSVDAR